ncbi:MAG: SDR family oxidoreductase [Myxococcales bacterium]|nr:SDR family oxidoreductase [Myxococcales bacterium]
MRDWIEAARARFSGALEIAEALTAIASARIAPPPSYDPRGKVVVITGAAGGIGRALAATFGRAGAKVALLDIDEAGVESAAAGLSALGVDVIARACDICDEERTAVAMATVVERFGGVDVLINNAGITHLSLLERTDAATVRKVMAVNFFGALHCTHAALPSIVSRRGVVVAISSVAGIAPLIGRTGYCASKHALHGFFDTLRNELHGSGVDVLLVCPSFVDTAIGRKAAESSPQFGDRVTRRASGEPHDPTLGGVQSGDKLRQSRTALGEMATPDQLAQQILEAVRHRERLLLPSSVARSAFWVSRLAPQLYDHLMRASQRALFER